MNLIKEEDFVASIENAFQWISAHHPKDFLKAMHFAFKKESHFLAQNAIGQILENAQLAFSKNRPICQDTGIAVVFVEMGVNARIHSQKTVEELVNLGVQRAYANKKNPLRASILKSPADERKNTQDNTPAVVHLEMVAGDSIKVTCAAKGGGSEAKTRFAMLNPSDDLNAWVVEQVKSMGAGWCPPGIIGLGIGGTPEKAMLLAKKSLMSPVDMPQLLERGAQNKIEERRIDLFHQINALKIGAQGLGGDTTVLDVKILEYPTHAANLPVALMPNCAATRHCHFVLNGEGAAVFEEKEFPIDFVSEKKLQNHPKINLGELNKEKLKTFKAGDFLLLSGKMLTARDAAHKKLCDLIKEGKPLPVDLKNRALYYVGPVKAAPGEIVGPAGPTTATRMDKFTPLLLQKTGLLMMIGKAERGKAAREAILQNGALYAVAVGGAALLVSQSIRSSRALAFPELGMEAIYEMEVENMPVIVALDSQGGNIYAFQKNEALTAEK